VKFRVLGFVNFNSLLVPQSLSSSLGAGLLGKRTQKPLVAHQERILVAMKENTFILQTKLRTVYLFLRWKFDIIRLLDQLHHIIIPVVSLLSFVTQYFAQ
jgi:hypothetical protein